MKRFEDHLREQDKLTREERRTLRQRMRRRERERRIAEVLDIAIIVLATLLVLLIVDMVADHYERENERGTLSEAKIERAEAPVIMPEITPESLTEETGNTVKAKYFDVPMERELQDMLRIACEESGVPMELALAVICRESTYGNKTGDGGESAGYMQVQKKWHVARMERLGVTDLYDPAGNFRVGCDYLAELLGKYPKAQALTFYNSGTPGESEYALAVMAIEEQLYGKS